MFLYWHVLLDADCILLHVRRQWSCSLGIELKELCNALCCGSFISCLETCECLPKEEWWIRQSSGLQAYLRVNNNEIRVASNCRCSVDLLFDCRWRISAGHTMGRWHWSATKTVLFWLGQWLVSAIGHPCSTSMAAWSPVGYGRRMTRGQVQFLHIKSFTSST